jgi:glycosyltransferase involved in cell wall biosynthesis
LEGLLADEQFQSELSLSVWHVPDLYRGVLGKIKLLRDCRRKISSKKFDKIYISHDLNLAALLVLNYRLLGFAALIVHSHAAKFYANEKSLKAQSYQVIVRFLAKQKVAVSEEASKAMYGANAKNVVIIPAFIDFESLWKKSLEPFPHHKSDDQSSVVFGCVGRLSAEKNQALVIRALAKVREKGLDAQLIIIGGGKLRAGYEKLTEELDLQNHVLFVGEVENISPYYRSFIDVLLVPSLYEGQGRIVAEAQLFGLPVVVSHAVPDIAFLTGENIYRVGSCSEDDWAAVMEERVKRAPERSSSNLEMALSHPNLSMGSGVDKVLSVIKS